MIQVQLIEKDEVLLKEIYFQLQTILPIDAHQLLILSAETSI